MCGEQFISDDDLRRIQSSWGQAGNGEIILIEPTLDERMSLVGDFGSMRLSEPRIPRPLGRPARFIQ